MPGTNDHGIAISGATTGTLGKLVSITPPGRSIVMANDTGLDDTDAQQVGGDVVTHTPTPFTVRFDSTTALPVMGTSEVWTITHKQNEGETAPATYSGTAVLQAEENSERVVDPTDTMTRSYTLEWTGETPPAFTPATTV